MADKEESSTPSSEEAFAENSTPQQRKLMRFMRSEKRRRHSKRLESSGSTTSLHKIKRFIRLRSRQMSPFLAIFFFSIAYIWRLDWRYQLASMNPMVLDIIVIIFCSILILLGVYCIIQLNKNRWRRILGERQAASANRPVLRPWSLGKAKTGGNTSSGKVSFAHSEQMSREKQLELDRNLAAQMQMELESILEKGGDDARLAFDRAWEYCANLDSQDPRDSNNQKEDSPVLSIPETNQPEKSRPTKSDLEATQPFSQGIDSQACSITPVRSSDKQGQLIPTGSTITTESVLDESNICKIPSIHHVLSTDPNRPWDSEARLDTRESWFPNIMDTPVPWVPDVYEDNQPGTSGLFSLEPKEKETDSSTDESSFIPPPFDLKVGTDVSSDLSWTDDLSSASNANKSPKKRPALRSSTMIQSDGNILDNVKFSDDETKMKLRKSNIEFDYPDLSDDMSNLIGSDVHTNDSDTDSPRYSPRNSPLPPYEDTAE